MIRVQLGHLCEKQVWNNDMKTRLKNLEDALQQDAVGFGVKVTIKVAFDWKIQLFVKLNCNDKRSTPILQKD